MSVKLPIISGEWLIKILAKRAFLRKIFFNYRNSAASRLRVKPWISREAWQP